jgi:hypothetical protein
VLAGLDGTMSVCMQCSCCTVVWLSNRYNRLIPFAQVYGINPELALPSCVILLLVNVIMPAGLLQLPLMLMDSYMHWQIIVYSL